MLHDPRERSYVATDVAEASMHISETFPLLLYAAVHNCGNIGANDNAEVSSQVRERLAMRSEFHCHLRFSSKSSQATTPAKLLLLLG
jgi:hypothetical protein